MIHRVREIVPYQITPAEEVFKYLGFFLKPNSYSYQDWVWLYKKIENMVNNWANHFLSRGGILVLLKDTFQSIPIYWDFIAYIPKGILTKIRNMCFSFLWSTSKQIEGIVLA